MNHPFDESQPPSNNRLYLEDDSMGTLEAISDAHRELERATKLHSTPMLSAHEGYAILKEEVDEAWEEIKKNDLLRAREEMVQVAAMAIRFLRDSKNWKMKERKKDEAPSVEFHPGDRVRCRIEGDHGWVVGEPSGGIVFCQMNGAWRHALTHARAENLELVHRNRRCGRDRREHRCDRRVGGTIDTRRSGMDRRKT